MKTAIKSITLTLVSLFIMLTFTTSTAKAQEPAEKVYIKIEVDGLACPFCAYGLEKKLKKVDGAENVLIEITKGEATMNVPASKKPSVDELRKIIKNAGFTPGEITFSDKPFKSKKNE